MKTGYATLGDQQVLDVELDRKTDILPARPNPIQWKVNGVTVASSSPGAKPDVPSHLPGMPALFPYSHHYSA